MVSGLNSTEKVLMILKAFLPDNRPRGTLELCNDLNMKPATVSRILGILKKYNFIQQDGNRKYHLGEVTAALGQAFNESRTARLLAVMKPQLMRLNSMLNENIHLELLSENSVKLAAVLKGTKSVQFNAEPGKWMGINASAGSKAILAFSTPNRLKGIKNAHPILQKFRPKSITDWSELERQLEEVRKAGIAYDHDEYLEEIYAVAAPIFDSSGEVFGAVAVPVPVNRKAIIFEQEIIDLLKKTAKNITASLSDLPTK